jgi:hypothetical protein
VDWQYRRAGIEPIQKEQTMPAHIGFLETFKMGLNSLTTNISPSSTSRRARSALASQRQNLRGQAQGLAVGVPDPVQQFGDSLLSLSDVQNRLERNRSGREHRCDSYEAYRSYLDNRSPYLERERNATVHADYISKPEWDLYLNEQTWFDIAMHALFLVPGGFYALLIARKSDQYQLKRIEGTNQVGTAIMWSFAEGCQVPNVPAGRYSA